MRIIENRFSCRVFNEEEFVKQEDVEKLLKAAMSGPSSKNKRPWQFVVVDNPELIFAFKDAHKNWTPLQTVNKFIMVCGDLEKDNRLPQLLMSCAAVTQNILLKATELGFGSLWLGLYPDEVRIEFARKTLKLPDHVLPISLVAIGYPKTNKTPNREIDLELVHNNGW